MANRIPADWNAIHTVVNLNGNWTDGSPHSAAIAVDFSNLTVNMSAFSRPTAHGTIVSGSSIKVTFPDDKTYTGELQTPNRIHLVQRFNLDQDHQHCVRSERQLDRRRRAVGGDLPRLLSIRIDMSDYDRADAHGSIVDASEIKITFPDDKTYTAQVQSPNKIRWSNGSVWTKKPDRPDVARLQQIAARLRGIIGNKRRLATGGSPPRVPARAVSHPTSYCLLRCPPT